MVEQKAAIAMLDVADVELQRVSKAFGYILTSANRLTGGFSSSNFRVECVPEGGGPPLVAVLKFSYAAMPRDEIEHQLGVLDLLERGKFPTNYLLQRRGVAADASLVDRYLVTASDGGGPWALLVTWIDGIAGDKLLVSPPSDLGVAECVMFTLGAALGQLHALPLLDMAAVRQLRGIDVGFPVCNTGELLSDSGEVEECLATAAAATPPPPFVAFLGERLDRFRQLYRDAASLPAGFIHGDAYLDNAMFAGDSGRLVALVDWEDSCVAPYALDVAVCLSAAAFTAGNELQVERCRQILAGYSTKRELSSAELASLGDFMWAAALACGFYRWREFNVHRPDSPPEAKLSYVIMQRRCEALEGGAPLDPRDWVDANKIYKAPQHVAS